MTRNQWIIIGALAVGVILEFCLIGGLLISRLPLLMAQNVSVVSETPGEGTPEATIYDATPMPSDTPLPPTPKPAASSTATLVVQYNPPVVTPTVARMTPTARPRVSGPLQDAWDRFAQPIAMRFEIQMTMKDNVGNVPGSTTPLGEFVLLDTSGESNGKDSHLIMKGYAVAALARDPRKGVEMISQGDQMYVRGPAPLLGAPEDKWYVGSAGSVFGISPGNQSPDMFKTLNPDLTVFKKTSSEALDGRRCDVYRADEQATREFLNEILTGMEQAQSALQQVSNVELKIWICDDGYLHQLTLNMEGQAQNKPDQKASISMRFHCWDLNSQIEIQPPPNPAPLQPSPLFKLGTPTATTR